MSAKSDTNSDSSLAPLVLQSSELVIFSLRGYTIGSPLGAGGFGTVYRGTHYGTPIAIKAIHMEKSRWTKSIANEVLFMKTIHHPSIVSIHDLFYVASTTTLLIIMEFMAGGDLGDYITVDRYLAEPKAARFLRQIIAALAYMHGRGYAHRDVKPVNVLLDQTQTVAKVADFGLVLPGYDPETGHLKTVKSLAGTVYYKAPEMHLLYATRDMSESYLGYNAYAADVWAAGVLFYEMLHQGDSPFAFLLERLTTKRDTKEGRIEQARYFYEQMIEHKPVYRRGLSERARSLTSWMLQIDPDERPLMAEVLNDAWFSCAEPMLFVAAPTDRGTPTGERDEETAGAGASFGQGKYRPCQRKSDQSGQFPRMSALGKGEVPSQIQTYDANQTKELCWPTLPKTTEPTSKSTATRYPSHPSAGTNETRPSSDPVRKPDHTLNQTVDPRPVSAPSRYTNTEPFHIDEPRPGSAPGKEANSSLVQTNDASQDKHTHPTLSPTINSNSTPHQANEPKLDLASLFAKTHQSASPSPTVIHREARFDSEQDNYDGFISNLFRDA